MVLSHKAIISFLLVLITANSVSVCPSGSISYDTFNLLAEDAMQHRSLQSDVFYRMTYQNGNYNLNCYRVADQQSASDPILSIKTFSTLAQSSWIIKAVSQRGSCVGVQQGTNFVTYNTYSGSFVQVQTISTSSFGSNVQYFVNDNCSMIRVVLTNNAGITLTKVFKDQVETALVLPEGTLFSYDFSYAIDTSSNFYTFASSVYVAKNLPKLKSTPLYIKWSSLLKAVITVTKDTNGYSILVIDPANSDNSYSKQLSVGTDYTGDLGYLVRTTFGSILLKDSNGFVSFIQLSLSNSLLTASTFALKDSSYSALFNSNGIVSVSNDIIFVYNNKTITYFQAYSGVIYYLGQLATDILAASQTFRTKSSTKDVNFVLSLAAPSTLNLCTPITTNTSSTSNVTTANQVNSIIDDVLTSVVTDTTSGQTLKCPDSCVTCKSAEICTICRVGYSLNDATGKCVFCKGCLSCSPTNPAVCYLCFAPAVLNRTSSTCVLPSCTTANCLICDITGTCTRCKFGYGLANSTCQKCSVAGCKSCALSADSCDANSCMLGYAYYLNPTTSKGVCQSCVSGCDVCLTTDLSACSSCSAGYYSAADSSGVNRCNLCFENCRTCTSANVCTKCVPNYVPSADSSSCTLKCNDNCFTCSQSNASTCLSCYAGSVLNTTSNECSIDLSCNSTSTCLVCSNGYVLNSGQCFQCSYTDVNCQGCQSDSLSECSRCNTGFYLSNGACVQCTGNCTYCVGQTSCAKCNDGFYLVTTDNTETGNCQVCSSSCLTCSGTSTTCTSCASGFTLEGSTCISNNRVVLDIVIQANVYNFIEFMEDLLNWLETQANQGKAVDAADISAQQIAILATKSYGSSVATALISSSTPTNTESVAAALSKAINSGASVNGYQIISGSATAQTTSTPVSPATSSSSSSNLGIILGIVIPVSLIILVVSAIVGYKIYQRRKESVQNQEEVGGFQTDAEKYSNKQFTYSNSKVSEKI